MFTLSAVRTIDAYATLDSNSEDGILYDTLEDCEQRINDIVSGRKEDTDDQKEWARKVVVKFGEIKLKEKNCFNFHTHKIIGFEEGALDIKILEQEFNFIHTKM